MGDDALALVAEVYPVDADDARLAVQLFATYRPKGVAARDVLHAAVMKNAGLTEIISTEPLRLLSLFIAPQRQKLPGSVSKGCFLPFEPQDVGPGDHPLGRHGQSPSRMRRRSSTSATMGGSTLARGDSSRSLDTEHTSSH